MSTNRRGHGVAKPDWFRLRLPDSRVFGQTRQILRDRNLHTVCEEAGCPNIGACYSARTATFIILGPRCTRNCRFCGIKGNPSGLPDPEEPERIAAAARELGLAYVVVTSVTRDDLPDGGAGIFAATIRALRVRIPGVLVEVLIPDFQGAKDSLETILAAGPDVVNHNMETVAGLYPRVRPEAGYQRSLAVLDFFRCWASEIMTKSGLMLGLGEGAEELAQTFDDLVGVGCRILTLGQYLSPSRNHLPVARYVSPGEFAGWRKQALKAGFTKASCGPLVRSSYKAHELYNEAAVSLYGEEGLKSQTREGPL